MEQEVFKNTHKVLVSTDVFFEESYVSKCSSCKNILFELNKVDWLVIWNDIKYLTLKTEL
mgnify:CR=1 FL=1